MKLINLFIITANLLCYKIMLYYIAQMNLFCHMYIFQASQVVRALLNKFQPPNVQTPRQSTFHNKSLLNNQILPRLNSLRLSNFSFLVFLTFS